LVEGEGEGEGEGETDGRKEMNSWMDGWNVDANKHLFTSASAIQKV